MGVKIDTSDFDKVLNRTSKQEKEGTKRGLMECADTILAISRAEVPHDKGMLQASGFVDADRGDEVWVVYNKEYAAYQHEGIRKDGSHKIRHYGKGRKGKYLEDPLKINLSKFVRICADLFLTGI